MSQNDVLDLIPVVQVLLGAAILAWLAIKLVSFLSRNNRVSLGRKRRSGIAHDAEGLSHGEIVQATAKVRESRIERGKIADEEPA